MARVLALVTHCESVCKHNGRRRWEFVDESVDREKGPCARRMRVRACVSRVYVTKRSTSSPICRPNECTVRARWSMRHQSLAYRQNRDIKLVPAMHSNSTRIHRLEFDRPFANVSRKLNLHFTSQEALTLTLSRDPISVYWYHIYIWFHYFIMKNKTLTRQ